VWVNFTDRHCDVNESFWFVTESWINSCPVSSAESPANESVGVPVDVGLWSVFISDVDGNETNGTIECSNGESTSWVNLLDGTRSLSLSLLDYSTTYTVWVNFTDRHCDVNESFWFVTEDSI
jgi:hypothetical protein